MAKKKRPANAKQGKTSIATIAVRKRRLLVEKQLLQGHTSQTALAAAHGVTQATICNDLKAIREQWLVSDIEEVKAGRRQAVKVQEALMAEAHHSFILSRQATDEVTVSRKKCPVCHNKPEGNSTDQCPECLGQGSILIETTKTTSSPGDVSFLNTMRECAKECNRLNNLYPEKSKEVPAPPANDVIVAKPRLYDHLSTDTN